MELPISQYHASRNARPMRPSAPGTCMFELTPACNLRCHFCYVALDPYAGPYLSTEQVQQVIDTIAEAGVLFLVLTGGEIFSRRDFAAIYRYARNRGFLVTLFTNATLVNDRIAALLASAPPYSVEVSIYGADAEHYEGTTGIPGSFKRFERGVRLLQEARVPLLLKHTISTLTEDHLPAISAWCEKRGLKYRFSGEVENRHSGGHEPSLYRIEPRNVVRLRTEITLAATGGRRSMPLPECAVHDESPGAEQRLYRCNAGKESFFVDALGRASHCVLDREPSFSLLEMTWAEVWAGIGDWVGQPLPPEAPCSGCGLRSGCSNCPARARLATGSPYLKDQYHCDVTHSAHGLPPAPRVDHQTIRRLGACVV